MTQTHAKLLFYRKRVVGINMPTEGQLCPGPSSPLPQRLMVTVTVAPRFTSLAVSAQRARPGPPRPCF